MPKDNTTTESPAAGEAAKQAPEPANVSVFSLENRLQIGKAIVAYGKVDFPLTETDAKALEALGKVRILGLF